MKVEFTQNELSFLKQRLSIIPHEHIGTMGVYVSVIQKLFCLIPDDIKTQIDPLMNEAFDNYREGLIRENIGNVSQQELFWYVDRMKSKQGKGQE